MRIRVLGCWLLMLGVSVSCTKGSASGGAGVPGDKHFATLDVGGGRSLSFAYHLPDNYDPEVAYPVLIGPGEGIEGSDDSYYWQQGDPSAHGWIIVESMAFLGRDPVETTRKLLDHLSETFNVEGGKFHVVGWSANSGGSFRVAFALASRFHSVTGVPGHPRGANLEALVPALKALKFQFLVGEHDPGWLRPARQAHKQLQDLGLDSRLEIIEGAGHVIEEIRGRAFMQRMDQMR